jgi:uncharacterized protein (TIRG00374 family)
LSRASAGGLAVYALLTALVVLGYALRWRLVARAVGDDPPLGRLVSARLAGDALGSLVPSAKLAGEPLRVALARCDGTPTAQTAAGVAIDRLLEWIGNTLAVMAYVMFFGLLRGAAHVGQARTTLAAVMAVLLVALAALIVRLRRGARPLAPLYGARARAVAPRLAAWMDGAYQIEEHLGRFFRDHPRPFLLGVLCSGLIEALCVVQYHALLAAFGIELELPTLLLVLLGSGVAGAMPAPAALGALEAIQVAVVGTAAGRPDLGFVVGVIVRLHETLLLALGLLVLSYRGISVARLRAVWQRAGA